MNSGKKIQGKINNLSNYLQYCESLKKILEETPYNNLNVKGKQIKDLGNIKNSLDDLDLYIDFFDEMNGIVSEFETVNIKIENKIKELKKTL